jgi:glutamine synthetase
MRHFVAGQVKYMPEVLPMVCATVNAYRRMVPGMWAPMHANWGVENRTTSVRVIPGGPKGQRSEYRIGPADANPYLALAAALATGLRGIEEQLELPARVDGNAYEAREGANHVPLPTTLRDATLAFEKSTAAREMFGDTFVDHFAATRHWEDRQSRKHVSDWDLARYFEII